MDDRYFIQVSKDVFEKLNKLAKTLGVKLQDLAHLAIEELFQSVKEDPAIFLEIMGINDRMRKIITN